jgi:hypothetical protein
MRKSVSCMTERTRGSEIRQSWRLEGGSWFLFCGEFGREGISIGWMLYWEVSEDGVAFEESW